ncbi:Sin3 family co-repressor-domain-containing protein [Dichotomocladium elegans]|nr:Sin3 family co-repressor-domain-containing protein [Dichotomocladium elegans]
MAHKSSPPKRRALPRTPAPVFEAETEPPPPPPPPPPSTMKPAPCDKPSPIVAPILKYVQSPVFESSNADPPPSIWVPPDLTPLPESELSSDLGPLSSCEVSPRLDPLSSVSVTTESAAYPQALHIEDSTTHSHLPQSMESDCYNSDSDSADNDIFPTSIITMEDIEMHRLIRKHINRHNRSYKEYLKLITLYTNGIFDADLIIKHAKPFIGDNPLLFQWLKSIVNYQLSTNEDIHQPRRLTPKPALHTCETINDSPSYRRVPSEWESQPCSGRDGLCQEVLNDKYVSYPRWNREDSDFPASKKNIFEDGMHNCEEARYSFDIVLDALQSAIAALELLLKSPPAESIVLDTVVRISVKLVYGPQRAHEIERLLGLYFAEAAPTVLDRLRQKSKEWKQAQYELLPVWRENDTKNYYRALDYAGGAFRTSDRKATTLKAMVADIRALSEKGGHYIFSFSDLDIFQDIFRISLVHASRQLSAGEHQTIQLFFQEVFAFIFHIQCNQVHAHCDQTRLQAATAPPPSVVDDDDSEEYDDARSTLSDMVSESAATSDNQTLFVKHDDLDRSARYAEKRNATIASEFLDALRTPNRQKQFRFFCDTTFYCFFRTLQLVYERLRGLKQLDKPRRLNSIALKLGLYGDHVPESESCYNRMLTIVESLFMGDINHNTFEEQLRVLFITQAYPLFTIDKIISNLTKSVLALTTEWRAVDLVRLFLQGPTPDYRQRAMDIIRPEESLFDVEVDIDARTLTMKTVSETPP